MGTKEHSHSAHLQSAFADFEAASGKLATFYQNLEGQVMKLTEELNNSRAAQAQQLREKEIVAKRLGSLLEALPAGVVVLDGAGCIAEFNPAAVDLLGPLRAGGRWIDTVTKAFQPLWDDGHDISLTDGRRVNIATEALQGEPGQILVLKDVTETRRLQERLNHHRRLSAKTELAAALAHQIRTPLAAAMLHTSNLSSRTCDEPAHRHGAVRAMESMRQLERLVEDMLTFARDGKFDGDTIALGSLLEHLAANVATNTPGSDFRFELEGEIPSVQLFGNAEALLSMMLNLVDNARAASSENGRLRVTVSLDKALVHLCFEDNGPGIPTRDHEHIFEPFYSTSNSGTGLGLAVARSIARAHGGTLELDIGYECGARFVVSLPLPQNRSAVTGIGAIPSARTEQHATQGAI